MQDDQYSATEEVETELENGTVEKGLLSKARNYAAGALTALVGMGMTASPALASEVDLPEQYGPDDQIEVFQGEVDGYNATVIIEYEGEPDNGEEHLPPNCDTWSLYLDYNGEEPEDEVVFSDVDFHDLNGNGKIDRGDILNFKYEEDVREYKQNPQDFASLVKKAVTEVVGQG